VAVACAQLRDKKHKRGPPAVTPPAYTPAFAPTSLSPIIHEGVANRTFRDPAELMKAIESRCDPMENNRDQVRALTKYHGWPTEHLCEG